MSSSASDFRSSERAQAPAEPVRLVVKLAIVVGVAGGVGHTVFSEQAAALEQCQPACELGAPFLTGDALIWAVALLATLVAFVLLLPWIRSDPV